MFWYICTRLYLVSLNRQHKRFLKYSSIRIRPFPLYVKATFNKRISALLDEGTVLTILLRKFCHQTRIPWYDVLYTSVQEIIAYLVLIYKCISLTCTWWTNRHSVHTRICTKDLLTLLQNHLISTIWQNQIGQNPNRHIY